MNQIFIALVEDDPDDQDFISTALLDHYPACVISIYQNGGEFLQYISSGEKLPDIVVTDLRMPLVTGFDVIAGVKLDGRMQHVPVVVLSTSSQPEDIDRATSLGANGYFVKPHNFNDYKVLTANIFNAIRGKLDMLSAAAAEVLDIAARKVATVFTAYKREAGWSLQFPSLFPIVQRSFHPVAQLFYGNKLVPTRFPAGRYGIS